MTTHEIRQKVIGVIAQNLSKDAALIHGDTRLAEELGVDSFGAVELMFELEEAFGLKIDDGDLARVRTVDDIVTHLASWLEKNKPEAS